MRAIDDRGPAPRCPTPFNATAYVLAEGMKTPDKIALAVLGPSRAERWSYARLIETVGAAQSWLLSKGIQPGDRLLLRLGNTPDVPVAYLAAIAAGILPVPTSSVLTEAEVTRLAADLQPTAILHSKGVNLPADCSAPILDVSEMRSAPAAQPDPILGDPDRVAYLMTTSGTSGRPRLVRHAHRAIWARHMMRDGWTDMRSDDRVLHAGAFNWTYTLGTGLLDPWSVGATALIPAEGATPELMALLLSRHDATIFAAVPGIYRKLLASNWTKSTKLRHCLSAGEKLPDAVRDAWFDATNLQIHEAFGQTEVSTFLSGSPDKPAPRGTLGYAQPGRSIAILGPDGPCERGEAGSIAIRANDPGLTLDAEGDGWVATGDVGQMQEDGAIVYLGRADDTLTAGGFRISPIEVEDAMLGMPGLTGIGVADVEIKPGVRVVGAFYTANDPLDETALDAHAAERLAPYKRPRKWVHLEELPRNVNGKLLRRRLTSAKPITS